MYWTAISYNWKFARTRVYTLESEHSNPKKVHDEFEESFPGEDLLALMEGDMSSSIATFPLTKWMSSLSADA